jgi:hypothetical protein
LPGVGARSFRSPGPAVGCAHGWYKGDMRLIVITVVVALQLIAQTKDETEQPGPWKRHVMTAKGDWFDAPESHPLAYFTRYPALLDESGDFCYLCTPEKRLAAAMAAKEPRAEVRFVGKIRALSIYDVFYRFQSEGSVDWKSILIKTGPDTYREIYHCEPTQVDARALPSTLMRVGKEVLLHAPYSVGGNKGMVEDDYYSFRQNGPIRVDLP